MRKMIQLAERFACHVGGGGTSSTSSEIPEEWKPYYTEVVQNALGAMGNLPLFGGGGGGGTGDGGDVPPPDDGKVDLSDPNAVGSGIRRPTRRVDDEGGNVTSDNPNWWVPEGTDTTWRPDQGAYAWAPAGVAGPSALEGQAASGASTVGQASSEFNLAGDAYAGGMGSVSGKGIKDMPAIQEALGIFEESIRPSVLNQAALTGMDAGTAENVALAKAKASYLMPTIFKGLDLEESAKGRSLMAGQGYAGLAGQGDARRFGAIEAQSRIGREGRAITQAEMDAQERERQRLISASERINLGPLASLLPSVMGSTTTTSQNKF